MENLKDLHICFVSDRSYPLFVETEIRQIGGVETRSLRLAKMMSKYFKKVSFAIMDTGSPVVSDHGLTVRTYTPTAVSDKPNPGIVKIDADIYICFESNHITADVVRTCNIVGKTVVFWCTSNIDFHPDYQIDNYDNDPRGFKNSQCAYAFHFADHIVSQTKDQQQTLKKEHKLESVIIRNPIAFHPDLERRSENMDQKPQVLWIGRTDNLNKRPEKLLEVAQGLPDIDFKMILNNFNQELFDKVVGKASANIEIVDYVPADEMDAVFSRTNIFFSSSSKNFEGFPNVFLHAVTHGVPIVSLEVDPDQIFSKHGCGIVCDGKIELARKAILDLTRSQNLYDEVRMQAFNHLKRLHEKDIIENELVGFLGSIQPQKYSTRWTEVSFGFEQEIRLLEDENEQLAHQISMLNQSLEILKNDYTYLKNTKPVKIANQIKKFSNQLKSVLKQKKC
jgi:hypothetical protein